MKHIGAKVAYSPVAFTWSEAQAGARAFSPAGDPAKLLGGALAAADACVVLLSAAGAFLLRHGLTLPPYEMVLVALLAAVLAVNAFGMTGRYSRHMKARLSAQVGHVAQCWSVVFVLLVLLAYFTKTSEAFSRVWAVTWYCSALVGLTTVRFAAAVQLRRWRRRGKLARTVAIVDLAGRGETLARSVLRDSADNTRLVGVFLPVAAEGRANGVADLIALSRLFRVDDVLVAISWQEDSSEMAIIRKLGTLPTNVRLVPPMPEMDVVPREAGLLFGQPVLTVYHRPLMGWNRVIKRTEDLVLTTVAVLLLGLFMAGIAVLIKLDSPGPVLFRQRRLGFNNNVMTVYKFRTMHHTPVPTAIVQARRNDPRVTRIGRFLRKSSLDELPQLFNVLHGEMSLVGPRPHAIAHNDEYAALIDDYLGRHRVQPGITGWAQVNGWRGETETLDKMRRRVEHDLAYIDSWSLLLDLRILFLTVFRTLFDRNAY